METLAQDLKFAIRQLLKDKGFLSTAGVTLALCIGANAMIFSVVNSVILRPLDVPDAERIVRMFNVYPGAMASAGSGRLRGSNGVPDYFDRRALTEVFEEVGAYDSSGVSIEIEGSPQRVRAQFATPSFFSLLSAEAAIGRTFTEQESELGTDVVVLSYGLWQQLYGEDASVVGTDIRMNSSSFTIVGIMPRDFVFLDPDVRLWRVASFEPETRQQYHSNNWSIIAKLQPGVSLQQAQQRVDALNAANMDKMPELKPLLIDAGFHTPLYLLQEDLTHDVRGILYLLWGGVGFVLLIGCVNVANLVLVRSTARARELATRFALGARRRQVVRQLLTETVVLTLGGGAVGLLLGQVGLRALSTLGIDQLPRAEQIQMDTTAVAFTFALALAVGAVVALIPLVSVWRMDLSSVFRQDGRSGTAAPGVRLLRKGMVVAQVAFALMLLVGAGLLMASFRELLNVDAGFETNGVLTGSFRLVDSRYPEDVDRRTFLDEAMARIAALPGVDAVGATSQIPLGGSYSDSVIFAEGYVVEAGESVVSPAQSIATDGYFEAMGIEVVQGRGFDDRDTSDGQAVVIVDERLANRFWPDGDAVGKRMWMPTSAASMRDPADAPRFDVIGVVESIQFRGLDQGEDTGMYYFPHGQNSRRGYDIAIKTAGDPAALTAAVRGALGDIDSDLPFFGIRTMQERLDTSVSDRRVPMLLTAGFSFLALLLSAVGIYGVLAYLVQLRTREIGIRMALGSDARSVFRLVLREGATLLGAGVVLGLLGTVAVRRVIEAQLFGVAATDPRVIGMVAVVLTVVALSACLIPARRATRIDPVAALTQD